MVCAFLAFHINFAKLIIAHVIVYNTLINDSNRDYN